jgi:hypothetical protein
MREEVSRVRGLLQPGFELAASSHRPAALSAGSEVTPAARGPIARVGLCAPQNNHLRARW